MKYVIVYLIKGKAEKYHQALVKNVGPRFGEMHLIDNPLPSHVTLKAPFSSDNIEGLENVLKGFVERQKLCKVKINGFGEFDRHVAFMKTKFSEGAKDIQKELIKELEQMGIKPHEFDRKHHAHATIAYGNTKKSFDDIWDYLKTKEKPEFDLGFDNITILRKPRKYWEIYKEFRIK
tara:strand:+ start:6670 stop:7200 length:531 start_codon:yes stop_codon:yes gene_type:complete